MTETYDCEQCGESVDASVAYVKERPGYRGTVTLAFCPTCTKQENYV